MSKQVCLQVANNKTYSFDFADISVYDGNIIVLEDAKCHLEDKITLFKAGVIPYFSSTGLLHIDMTKAEIVTFGLVD